MPLPAGVAARRFVGADGSPEHFITVEAPPSLSLEAQIAALETRYAGARHALGLPPGSAVFRRVFVSDVLNQAAAVRASSLAREEAGDPAAVSIVQQAPMSGAKVALLAYHIESPEPLVKRRVGDRHVLVEKNGLRHLWSTGLCAGATAGTNAAAQTDTVFGELIDVLERQDGRLLDHCVRTWIYLKDVDVFYGDMVKSRIAVFDRHGLTTDTHYIASTGIEGACAHQFDVVAMDAYCLLDMAPGQMSFLNDFAYMCPTRDYNVTFERGTRIAYADRAHHFISGTASIDRMGKVVHLGDTLAQLERALVNVDAILKSGGGGLADLQHLLVYLRDPTDAPAVQRRLDEQFRDLPILIVQGAVCRPEWLIEVEGIAISHNRAPDLPRF